MIPYGHRQLPLVQVTLTATVVPGHSLVGLYPHEMLRVERIATPHQPGLFLHRGGQRIPCDGGMHAVRYWERTLTIGNFLALHVENETNEPLPACFELVGRTIEGTKYASASLVQGMFAMESGESEAPYREDARRLEARAEAAFHLLRAWAPILSPSALYELCAAWLDDPSLKIHNPDGSEIVRPVLGGESP